MPKKLDACGERKWRIVIDFRALNEKIIGDAYPLPNILEIFDQLGKAQYFLVFDLASRFHQVETHPEDRVKALSHLREDTSSISECLWESKTLQLPSNALWILC